MEWIPIILASAGFFYIGTTYGGKMFLTAFFFYLMGVLAGVL